MHYYKRTCDFGEYVADATLPTNGAIAWTFGHLPDKEDFSNLYNAFKVKKLVYRFEQYSTSVDVADTLGNHTQKYIRMVIDKNDDNFLSNENEYFEYSNMRSYPMSGRVFKVVVYPMVGVPVYKPDTGWAFEQRRPSWIELTTNGFLAKHYGIKFFLPNTGLGAKKTLRVICTAYFWCKDTK